MGVRGWGEGLGVKGERLGGGGKGLGGGGGIDSLSDVYSHIPVLWPA